MTRDMVVDMAMVTEMDMVVMAFMLGDTGRHGGHHKGRPGVDLQVADMVADRAGDVEVDREMDMEVNKVVDMEQEDMEFNMAGDKEVVMAEDMEADMAVDIESKSRRQTWR